ncbi:unnamed protein product [Cochlearia groenlandica]
MEHKLATAEKKVLVELVKLVQKRGLEGDSGGWKEFLDSHDKKIGSSLCDPSRRSTDVLVAFLSTFKKPADLHLIARILQCDANRNLIDKFKDESSDKETPEQMLDAEKSRLEVDKTKLFLHKIPNYFPCQELQGVITGDFTVQVKPPKKKGGYYGAIIAFNSIEEANQAFDNVDAVEVKDTLGLPQKMAAYKMSRSGSEGKIYVRKMVEDGEISRKKRSNTEEKNESCKKRQRVEDDSEDM